MTRDSLLERGPSVRYSGEPLEQEARTLIFDLGSLFDNVMNPSQREIMINEVLGIMTWAEEHFDAGWRWHLFKRICEETGPKARLSAVTDIREEVRFHFDFKADAMLARMTFESLRSSLRYADSRRLSI